jgi:plastocyanin
MVAIASSVALAACGGGGTVRKAAPAQSGATATVNIKGLAFTPQGVTVPAGSTVAWFWEPVAIPHDVTFDGSLSSPQQEGGSWQRTFDKPGTYKYSCTVHPQMTGTVTVT